MKEVMSFGEKLKELFDEYGFKSLTAGDDFFIGYGKDGFIIKNGIFE